MTARIDVELLEDIAKYPVTKTPVTDNLPSVSEFRWATGGLFKRLEGDGDYTPWQQAFTVTRVAYCIVEVKIKMAGNVPARVALFPFNIDYELHDPLDPER